MDVEELVRLESEAWASESKRLLYNTPLIPGFPWYTTPTDTQHPARRHVVPYYYTFRVFVKGRWVGRSLLDVYSEEHAHHSRQYYEMCIQQGRLRRQERVHRNVKKNHMKRSLGVDWSSENNTFETAQGSTLLEAGDVVLHTVHRHEISVCMGVTGVDPVQILAVRISAYGIIVLQKPAGVPTHATGRYFMNSCTAMLEYVLAPKRLHAWLIEQDPLLQSVVSTTHLTEEEREELFTYYDTGNREKYAGNSVSIDRLPRPCHRLDRVTSGVLLLGVSRVATRRVGTALAKKTKQMEEVFLQQLQSVSLADNDIAKNVKRVGQRDCEIQAVDHKVLDSFDVGVRKRYLARVHGRFPSCALQSFQAQCGVAKNSENENKCLLSNTLFVVMTKANCMNLSGHSADDEIQAPDHFGPPVLLASPLLQFRFSDDNNAGEELLPLRRILIDATENKQQRRPLYQAAATFCQPMRYFCSSGLRNDEETLVQCVPFSGRMHQIRMHLSDWGHSIIGDVSYSTEGRTATCFRRSMIQEQDRDDENNIRTNNDETVFFCPSNLPKVYRELFYTHDEECWECTGKIPLACFDGRNSGSIELHAWRYELDHHLLVCENPENTAGFACLELAVERETETNGLWQRKEIAPQEEMMNHGDEEMAFGLCCTLEDLKQHQGEYIWRKGKKVVVFSAPPPLWSQQ